MICGIQLSLNNLHSWRLNSKRELFCFSGMSGIVASPFSAVNPFALPTCNGQTYGSSIISAAKWCMNHLHEGENRLKWQKVNQCDNGDLIIIEPMALQKTQRIIAHELFQLLTEKSNLQKVCFDMHVNIT